MVAVAFSNVWIFVRDSFQSLDTSSNAVSLRSLISTPAMFQVPFPPCSVNSTRRKPSLQTRPPHAAGQFAPSVRLRCKRRGHLPFRRQDLPGALLVFAPVIVPAGASWPSLGSGLRPSADRTGSPASMGLRRRELRRKPAAAILSWPPPRQGYFAPASRDAILLDGSLPATVGTRPGKKARHFQRLLQNVKQFRGLFLRNLIFEKTILRLCSLPRDERGVVLAEIRQIP